MFEPFVYLGVAIVTGVAVFAAVFGATIFVKRQVRRRRRAAGRGNRIDLFGSVPDK
jgi:hypothetical protein